MSYITLLVTFIGEVTVLAGVITPMLVSIRKLSNGTRCQLRSEMLRTYYRHVDNKQIRQYEFENFMALYDAYKTLRGNSFVDKIYEEVQTWKVVS